MNEKFLVAEQKLNEITLSLIKNHKKLNSYGLPKGRLGVSLFFYNHYKCFGDINSINISEEILFDTCVYITEKNTTTRFYSELIDLGKYLLFLYEEKQVDEAIIEILEEIDSVLVPYTIEKLNKQDLDPIVGAISAGYYFIKRLKHFDNQECNNTIQLIINKIDKIVVCNGYHYWNHQFRENEGTEIGISHGISGILLFLNRLYEDGLLENKNMLTAGIDFLKRQQFDISGSIFFYPLEVGRITEKSKTICLAYGDLGVAYSLYEISKTLKDNINKISALEIFKYYSTKKNRENYTPYDANLSYGSAGLTVLFKRLFIETGEKCFEDTANYWLKNTLDLLSTNQNDYAGFIPYWNSMYTDTYMSTSDGITGIGLALLYLKNPDLDYFFSVANYN